MARHRPSRERPERYEDMLDAMKACFPRGDYPDKIELTPTLIDELVRNGPIPLIEDREFIAMVSGVNVYEGSENVVITESGERHSF